MIIAATGHRPDKLGGYTPEIRENLRRVAREFLALHPRVSEAVSGMALGWDQAFAHAAIDLGIPVVAAIPFKGQAARWPEQAQAYYRKLIDRSARVVHVSPLPTFTQDAFQARNEWMVDYSHAIVALWNGSPGGTANCIDYARASGRTITNLWGEL
jgi:uncharacterized phage-like protein YoqJ